MANSYNQQVVADGATVFWELHDTAGSGSAADATSNGYTGTATTGITFGVGGSPIIGSPGTATTSDGVAGHWIVNSTITRPTSTFTQEIWVKPTATTPNYGETSSGTYGTSGANWVVKPVHTGASHGVGIAVGTNAVQVWAHGDSYLPCVLNYLTTISDWTYIVVVVNSNVAHLYINGVLVRDSPYSIGTAVGTNAVGGADYGGFNGQYACFAQYPTALDAATIANHYSLGTTAPPTGGGGSVSTGAGSGTGNMLGTLFLGETMLGADPGAAAGGGNGYGNTSNMLGQFMFGEPMLGADPSNGTGGGTAPVGPVGSVWQLGGQADGTSTVTADPTRNNWPLVGTCAGNATVSAGLSAPVHLAGESDGNASFTAARLGTLDALSGGESDGAATVTVTDLTDSILRSKPGPAGEATATGTLGLAFVFQLVPTINAGAYAYGSFGGPVDLTTARADGLASVTADLAVYLSGGSSAGSSTVTGDITRHILAGVCSGVATLTANLTGDIFTLTGSSAGDSSLAALIGVIFQVAAAPAGDSTVTGTFYYLIYVSGEADGSANVTDTIVIYNMAPEPATGNATVVGDYRFVGPQHFYASITGDSTVTVAMRWRGVLLPGAITGTSTAAGQMRRMWFLAGTPTGDSTGVGDFQIYTIPPGPIVGEATVTTTGMIIQGHMRGEADGVTIFGTDARGLQLAYFLAAPQTSNGVATTKAYLYDYPQDFEPVSISGAAVVSARIVLSTLALRGTTSGVASVPSGILGLAFTFAHAGTANGYATIDFALLQINDAGLSRGSALVVAQVSSLTGGTSVSRGFATFILGPSFTLPGDLKGTTVDTWSGVGTWHAGGTTNIYVTQEIDQPPPVLDQYGNPMNTPSVMEYSYWRYNYERINVGYWDGTYTYGPSESGAPVTDPETGLTKYVKVGSLKRQFSLADPGQIGGWYVDTRSYRRRGPWGTSAAFATVTADLFVEAKNALYGKPIGTSTVTVTLLRLAARLLTATGNVALAVAMSHLFGGNAAKSTGPVVPIDDPRKGLDPNVFTPPVRRDRTMYV